MSKLIISEHPQRYCKGKTHMLLFGRVRTLRSRADCNKEQFLVASGKESSYWSAAGYYWILPQFLLYDDENI